MHHHNRGDVVALHLCFHAMRASAHEYSNDHPYHSAREYSNDHHNDPSIVQVGSTP